VEKLELLMLDVLRAGAVDIRNVDDGEEAFLYASGNWGPGYVSIKNLVGRKLLIKAMVKELARRVAEKHPRVQFVAGNVTGGLVPGWIVSEEVQKILDRILPFVYVRDARKKGGQKELVTGLTNNPGIKPGYNCLVVEELVNFAQTTCNSALHLREIGYEVTHACCIMEYNNPNANASLETIGLELISLFTLGELLAVAEAHETHPWKAIDGYREFLSDPLAWQKKRGLKPVEGGGTK
jgi:orotate phosphoribosyltransferase